jgi:hypothetical protein
MKSFVTGKMILLRVIENKDGNYFFDTIRKLKKGIPALDKLFCAIIDDQVRTSPNH